jgi:hypothetical protein
VADGDSEMDAVVLAVKDLDAVSLTETLPEVLNEEVSLIVAVPLEDVDCDGSEGDTETVPETVTVSLPVRDTVTDLDDEQDSLAVGEGVHERDCDQLLLILSDGVSDGEGDGDVDFDAEGDTVPVSETDVETETVPDTVAVVDADRE